ncbi:hypothetical protein [Novosphingobium sp. 9]|uniref:hypothetical protein n=1 Tax=Novosphingobium sp. 9 TaxID=2025349 RepID=UPI0021B53C74|nr:hypothetical protein [Novosphingobium sp. 9]
MTETVAGRRARQMSMILALADLLEAPPPGIVHDVALLPFAKKDLLQALEEQIATNPDKGVVELFGATAVILAGYQEGVGASLVLPSPEDFQINKDDNSKIREMLQGIDHYKMQKFSNLADRESEEIYKMVQQAKARNPAMRPKTLWQRILGR